jgi:hypothetical protein
VLVGIQDVREAHGAIAEEREDLAVRDRDLRLPERFSGLGIHAEDVADPLGAAGQDRVEGLPPRLVRAGGGDLPGLAVAVHEERHRAGQAGGHGLGLGQPVALRRAQHEEVVAAELARGQPLVERASARLLLAEREDVLDARREGPERVVVERGRVADLLEVVLRLRAVRRLPDLLHRGEQQPDEDRDDRDDDEKLYQGEARDRRPAAEPLVRRSVFHGHLLGQTNDLALSLSAGARRRPRP